MCLVLWVFIALRKTWLDQTLYLDLTELFACRAAPKKDHASITYICSECLGEVAEKTQWFDHLNSTQWMLHEPGLARVHVDADKRVVMALNQHCDKWNSQACYCQEYGRLPKLDDIVCFSHAALMTLCAFRMHPPKQHKHYMPPLQRFDCDILQEVLCMRGMDLFGWHAVESGAKPDSLWTQLKRNMGIAVAPLRVVISMVHRLNNKNLLTGGWHSNNVCLPESACSKRIASKRSW